MRNILLAALLAGVAATPVLAQGTSDTVSAAAFTGARVEGLFGYEFTDVQGGDDDGIAYGVGAGFDFDLGSAVAGIEAEYSDSEVGATETNVELTGDRLFAGTGRDIYVGGRIGGKLGASTLAYAKGGYVNGKFVVDYADGTTAGLTSFRLSQKVDGFRAGAGLEQLIGRNAFAKIEYRYSNYEQGYEKHQGLAGVGLRF